MKVCEQCKYPFTPQRSTARFCSEACQKASARGTPPLPFDQEEAQLMIDVAVIMLKKDNPKHKAAGENELKRYAAIRDQYLAGKTPAEVDPFPPGTVYGIQSF
jgi:hypothetical protein